MSRPWTDEEKRILGSRASVATIAKKTGRSKSAIRAASKRFRIPLRGARSSRRPENRRAEPRPLLSAAGCASPALIAEFIREHLILVDGAFYGKPFELEPFQINDLLEPTFGPIDAVGNRLVSEALWGIPRDAGKSELTAALALALMILEPVHRGKYVVIAKNREQAALILEKAKAMVNASPVLRRACKVNAKDITVKATKQKFYALPWDDGAAQAVHAQLVIVDEYHVHRNSTVYYAALSGQTHQRNSMLLAISTAGPRRQGPLWDLIQKMRERLQRGDTGCYLKWIGAADDEDGHDPKVWKRANPQSWATEESLEAAYLSMPFWEFERYHLNRFPQAEGLIQAFSRSMIEANVGTPRIDPKTPVVFGIDAAPSRDRCALVVAQRAPDGRHHWQPFVWEPGRQMDFGDFEAIEQQVRDLAGAGLYITRIVSDPAFLWLALNRLKAEGFPVEVMNQGNAEMCNVAGNLHKMLSGGKLVFNAPEVMTDLANVKVEERPPWGWRMGKLDDAGHIDCAIAGGMASFVLEAEFMYSGPPVIVG